MPESREQSAAFDEHLATDHLVKDNANYILAGCLMNTKERNLVAAITEERQKKIGPKKKIRSTLNRGAPEMKGSKVISSPKTEEWRKEGMIDLNDYVNINLEEGVAPMEKVVDRENREAKMQFKCDQCDFKTLELSNLSKHMQMTSHYPPSDPLLYLDPKWVQEYQCNLCPKVFKTSMILKQHKGRCHKTDNNSTEVKSLEHTALKERLIIKSEKEDELQKNNIPANLVTEDLQRAIISRYIISLHI